MTGCRLWEHESPFDRLGGLFMQAWQVAESEAAVLQWLP